MYAVFLDYLYIQLLYSITIFSLITVGKSEQELDRILF